jgi:hypothetical protein
VFLTGTSLYLKVLSLYKKADRPMIVYPLNLFEVYMIAWNVKTVSGSCRRFKRSVAIFSPMFLLIHFLM